MKSESPELPMTSMPIAKTVFDIKRHIVQVEIMILLLTLYVTLLFLKEPLADLFGLRVSLLIPFTLLAVLPFFIRVNNPGSWLRSSLKYGLSGAGVGGTIGSGVAGPIGTAVGAAGGFIAGAIAGPFLDGEHKKVLTQGEARDLMVKQMPKYPGLTMQEIIKATEHPPSQGNCNVYMYLSDGVVKCAKEGVHKWLESECWKSKP